MFIDATNELADPKRKSGTSSSADNKILIQTSNSVNQVLNLFIDGETESKNNNSKLPLTYYDYFRLVYLKAHNYKEFLRQVDLYEVKVKNLSFKEAEHPRDEDGRFSEKEEGTNLSKEVQDKINSVNIDFSKDNVLPELNKEDLEELGIEKSKKILSKKINY